MFGIGTKKTYRVGLALSGGGARGFAHAGAIKALLEVGLKPDIVAGVSAGSVVAAMYAAGISPDMMLKFFQNAKFSDFCELSIPKDGFFKLDRFKIFLKKHIPYQNLEDLPIHTVIGVTDFDNCRAVAFENGSIVDSIAASCSIPIVFKPVRLNGTRYVDGGVLHNLPAWSIRDRCKFLIGINCSPLYKGPVKNSLMDIALRSYELMAKNNAVPDIELCDIVVPTDEIARYKVFDLKGIERVYKSGYRTTLNHLLYHGFKRKLR